MSAPHENTPPYPLGAKLDAWLYPYVKQTYFKSKKWGDKPFEARDIEEMAEDLLELSDRLTVDRTVKNLAYFDEARFRSAYASYWLPFQISKAHWILEQNQAAILTFFKFLNKKEIYVYDFGSGPGSMVIAFLYFLSGLDAETLRDLLTDRKIVIFLVDRKESVVKEAKQLVKKFIADHFKDFPTAFAVQYLQEDFSRSQFLSHIKNPPDFVFFGNSLNECHSIEWFGELKRKLNPLASFLFILEPAHPDSSKRLIDLRRQLLADRFCAIAPCFHNEKCPLEANKDWCHSSVPFNSGSVWFDKGSQVLGARRNFLKFTYLMIAKGINLGRRPERRILSEAIEAKQNRPVVLVCEPELAKRVTLDAKRVFFRGDVL